MYVELETTVREWSREKEWNLLSDKRSFLTGVSPVGRPNLGKIVQKKRLGKLGKEMSNGDVISVELK